MKPFKLLIALCFLSFPVYAQGEVENLDDFLQDQKKDTPQVQEQASAATATGSEAPTDMEASLAQAKEELADKEILAKKVALAKRMHEIRPTREQVDSAVNRAARNLPAGERQAFLTAMGTMLNYNAIERISMDAMVETYTLKELESMVEYFSKPEAMSASRKVNAWAARVQPEIARMIDKAMIRLRTGQ